MTLKSSAASGQTPHPPFLASPRPGLRAASQESPASLASRSHPGKEEAGALGRPVIFSEICIQNAPSPPEAGAVGKEVHGAVPGRDGTRPLLPGSPVLSPRSLAWASPGAAAQEGPAGPTPACAWPTGSPWSLARHSRGFADQLLPRSAAHGAAASWAQKWLLRFSAEAPAHTAGHRRGTLCRGPGPCQPPTAECERRKRECGYSCQAT